MQKNIDIYIESVSLIKNPEDPNDLDTYDILNRYINKTVNDIAVYYDASIYGREFSDSEKNMKFDLEKFNVYKLSVVAENATENKLLICKNTDFCLESKFILVPTDFPLTCIGGNYRTTDYYYFVSKEFSEEEFIQYLKNTGIITYIIIGEDELHPIIEYEKRVFFYPNKTSILQ